VTASFEASTEALAEAWAGDDEIASVVIAFDPGGTTGWALFGVHPEALEGDPDVRVLDNLLFWTAGEFTGRQDDQIDAMLDLIDTWESARIVTETFKLRQLNAELSPVEINACLRRELRARGRGVALQNAALAMGAIPDDRQKAMGFWIPGKPHARDAVKHGLTYLKRSKEYAISTARRAASAA
jgi:hypothetical protein